MTMETSKIHVLVPSYADGDESEHTDEGCATLRAINDVLAIFAAIDHGELLSVLPEAPADRAKFQTAISLLDIAHSRLREVVGNPEHLISDECRCNGKDHCGPRFR
jgi:hypothetical protein